MSPLSPLRPPARAPSARRRCLKQWGASAAALALPWGRVGAKSLGTKPAPEPSAGLLARPRARFSLPFHLVNGYILIDARVGSRAGRFMFDTGTEFPLFINRHVLPMAKDQFMARGHAASGQALVLYRQRAALRDLVLAGELAFAPLAGLPHADFRFLEAAISDRFLGTLGHGFSRDYEFVLDYDQQVLDFLALPPPGSAQDEAPQYTPDPAAQLLLAMKFRPTGANGKMPELEVQLGEQQGEQQGERRGDQRLRATVDTGNLGSLRLSPALREQLEAQGLLRVMPGRYLLGQPSQHLRASLSGLSIQGVALAPLHDLHLTLDASDAPGQGPHLGLGYQFLKSYVSVWNYRRAEIRLYRP